MRIKKSEREPKINKQLLILILIIVTNIIIVIMKFFKSNEILMLISNFLIIPGLAVSGFLATKYLVDRRII